MPLIGSIVVRNVYTLFDYGDWVDESSNDRDDPYIQLLSMTDKASARNDFIQARLGGVDTLNATSQVLLPADQGLKSPISKEEKKKMSVYYHIASLLNSSTLITVFVHRYEEKVLSRWPEIFVGCLIFVILLAALITWRCCVRRKRRRAAQAAKLGLSTNATARPNTYSVVDMNSSSTQLNMHEMTPKPQASWDHPYSYSSNNEYKGPGGV